MLEYFGYFLTSGEEPEHVFDFVLDTGLIRKEDDRFYELFLTAWARVARLGN